MENQKLIKSPFVPRPSVAPGLDNFDQDYKIIQIVDHVVEVGKDQDNKPIYNIEKVVIEDYQRIQDVIDQDAPNLATPDKIMMQFLKTGDPSVLPVDQGNCNVDLVGAPENLMDVKQVGVDAQQKFEKLPKELTEDMDMVSFINSMSQEKFDAFVKAISDRAADKKGE